jgi:hypothetical protein
MASPLVTSVKCADILIDGKPCCACCYALAIADPEAVAEEVKLNPDSYKGKIIEIIIKKEESK